MGRNLGRDLFTYLTTIVPYWRVSDDAWQLDDDSYLGGIGVLRNYGGDVLIVPWSDDPELASALKLPRIGRKTADLDRRLVVVDDRGGQSETVIAELVAPVKVIGWTQRQKIADFVVSDTPLESPDASIPSLDDLFTISDRTAAYMGLAKRYIHGSDDDRCWIVAGWDFGVDWAYPNWQRLACKTGEAYEPEEKIRAFLVSQAITAAKPTVDVRDDLVGLAIIYQSAVAAGLDANKEFGYIASISPPPVRALLEDFAKRADADKSLAAFRLASILNGDGEIEIRLDARNTGEKSAFPK